MARTKQTITKGQSSAYVPEKRPKGHNGVAKATAKKPPAKPLAKKSPAKKPPAKQPPAKPPAKPSAKSSRHYNNGRQSSNGTLSLGTMTKYQVHKTDLQVAFAEIQLINSPKKELTYGEKIVKHMLVPFKINGLEPTEYLFAFRCAHTDEEFCAYVKEWRVSGSYDFPNIQFKKKGGRSELMISVYDKMKATYNSLCRTHSSHSQNLKTVIDTIEEPVKFEDWCDFYKDGVKFIAHYHLLFPTLSCKQVFSDCVQILQKDIKRQVDFKRYMPRKIKELHQCYALDEMDHLKDINQQTEEKMVILRRILRNLGLIENGTNRVILTRLQNWVAKIPANEKQLLKEVSWITELNLEEQPDEKEKRLELEKKEAEKAEKKRKREEKHAAVTAKKAQKKRKQEEEKKSETAETSDDESVLSDGNSRVGPKENWESDDDDVPEDDRKLPAIDPVIDNPPVAENPPVIDNPPVAKNPPIAENPPVVDNPPVVENKTVEEKLRCISDVPIEEYRQVEVEIQKDIIDLCNDYSAVAFDEEKKPVLENSGRGKAYLCRDNKWKKTMRLHYSLLQRVMSDLEIHYGVEFDKKVKGLPSKDAAVLRCARSCGFITKKEIQIGGVSEFKKYALSWSCSFVAGSFYDTMLQLDSWLGPYTNSIEVLEHKFKMVKSAINEIGMKEEEKASVLSMFVQVTKLEKK